MITTFLLLLAAAASSGGEDPWIKVRELNSGSELRIHTTGEKRPIAGKFDRLSEKSLIIVLKNGQMAIPKDQIERVDCRAQSSGGSVRMETERNIGTSEEAAMGRSKDSPLPPRSTGSGIKIRPKAGFETVYRRPASSGN